jgi:hypothetical protein
MNLVITAAACLAAVLCAFQIWRLMRDDRRRSEARVAALAAVIDAPGDSGRPGIFGERSRMPSSRHPLLKVAVGFTAVVAIIIVVAMASDLHDEVDRAPKVAPPPSLALLSMQHERQAETFTITGVVGNQGASAAEGLSAVILAFDRTGNTVARVRAPIERQVLTAGERSSFRIAIPHGADISRYLVSFESDGGVIRHLDRRPRALAGGEAPSGARPARGRRAAEAWHPATDDPR